MADRFLFDLMTLSRQEVVHVLKEKEDLQGEMVPLEDLAISVDHVQDLDLVKKSAEVENLDQDLARLEGSINVQIEIIKEEETEVEVVTDMKEKIGVEAKIKKATEVEKEGTKVEVEAEIEVIQSQAKGLR